VCNDGNVHFVNVKFLHCG